MLSTESLPEPPFKITNEDLQEICNFDKRADPAHVEFLNDPLVGGIEGLAALLKTDPQNGLALKTPYHIPEAMKGSKSGKAVRVKIRDSRCEDEYDRREIFGENIIPPAPSETILQIIVGTVMEDPILKILIVGAFVVLTLGTILCPAEGWTEGLAIVIAVFIVLGVTAGNDWSKDRKFKKLLLLQTDKKCRTTRGGVKFELSSWDIYVGDLIELVVGDEVPADGIFVQGNGLVIDESPLTGETVPVKKNSNAPFIFSGCQVAEGSGFMIVTAVGMNSSGGKIQELLNEAQNEMTPLQEKLKEVAILIGKIGVAAGIITFLALGIRWAVDFVARKPLEHAVCSTSGISGGNDTISRIVLLVEHFVVAITVVVVAVPEGLPLAVTLALSLSMFKMMRDKCFVRHLDASETMGQATTICTDKTGTLTYNRMSVVRLMIKDRIFKGEGSGDKDAMPFSPKTLPPNILQLITENCCLNSNCFIKNEDQVNEAAAVPIFVGSATEGAILIMSKKFGVKYTQLRERIKVIPNGVWSFSADRKRMSVCIHDSTANKYRLYTKGASEIILKLCPKIYDPITGGTAEMSESDRAAVEKNIRSWASDGLRTLCLAYRDFDTIIDTSNPDAETSLVFLCLLAIKDPLRKEIPAAVATCQRAGIIVRMVTGDNILTATKIAKEANIFFGDGIAVEGPVFRSMSKAQQIATLPMLQVSFANLGHGPLLSF